MTGRFNHVAVKIIQIDAAELRARNIYLNTRLFKNPIFNQSALRLALLLLSAHALEIARDYSKIALFTDDGEPPRMGRENAYLKWA